MTGKPLSAELAGLILEKHGRNAEARNLDIIRELEPELYVPLLSLQACETSCSFIRTDLEMRIKSPEIWQIQLESCMESLEATSEKTLKLFADQGFEVSRPRSS